MTESKNSLASEFWLVLSAVLVFLVSPASGEDIAGEVKRPNQQFGAGASFRLIGDASFGWQREPITGDLNLNGYKFTMETGGGNRTVFSGVISGDGDFSWNGGGTANWQTTPSFFQGDRPNTFGGTLTILRGTLALAKPNGVAAIAGKQLVLGGGTNQAIIRLDASEQIVDTCDIVITGNHEGRIWTQGYSEKVGTLELRSHGYIDLGKRTSQLFFADSRQANWDVSKTLTIRNWTEGQDVIRFGTTENGLTTEQLAQIGFANPSARPTGLYTAKLNEDGGLEPNRKVEAINPPFDVSSTAVAEREKLYQIDGLANLTGASGPLKNGLRISFFGDSITWQNAYIREIRKAISESEATKKLEIRLLNHGVNGGGVMSIRDGSEKSAYVDSGNQNGSQAPFANVIASDQSDVAVVLIGINDVWWRKTSKEDFESGLRELVTAANENKTSIVLATLTVNQEKPDGSNPMDDKCDQFSEITRQVANSTNATLVDLRKVHLAYLQNRNAELRVDGSLNFLNTGVLTYDGIHPNANGNKLIAEHIAQGIYNSLQNGAGK